jgi:gliding motility-associated-like protein
MNLKDYQEQPTDGLFEKIGRRLAWRRAMRWGGLAVGAGVLVAAALLLAGPAEKQQDAGVAQAVVPAVAADESVAAPVVQATVAGECQAVVSETDAVAEVESISATTVETREARVQTMTAENTEPAVVEAEESVAGLLPVQPVHAELPAVVEVTGNIVDNGFREAPEPARAAAKGSSPEDQVPHYDNLLWAPNIILPDGDSEFNVFRVVANSEMTDYHLYIYNRNGRQIFITKDPNATWDATLDGARLPQGAYVWVAKFRDSSGTPRVEKGTVTVVR